MGYYMQNAYGAKGSFFGSIGHFLGGAVQRLAPVASVFGGTLGRIGTAITSHPIVSSVAGAAAASATTMALTGHTGAAGTSRGAPMPGGVHVHGHLHVGGRKGAAAGAPGGRHHRRMNVCNPRALRRAIRRARGFEHLAMKVIGFSRPHKPKGHPYFKKTRAKK